MLEVLDHTSAEVHPDWQVWADRWLDLVRPTRDDALWQPERRHPLLLKDIRHNLLEHPIPFEAIYAQFHSLPSRPPLVERIVTCILGVGDTMAS